MAFSIQSYPQNFSDMKWYNEPPQWDLNKNSLTIITGARTDFWRITHYGFISDNGHFFYRETEGEFSVKVKITGSYKELYDQAGLMIRIDDNNWIKSGIELVNGIQYISAVVTRDFSDWSVVKCDSNPPFIFLTFLRKGDFVEINYSFDDANYQLLRLAYFPVSGKVMTGIMCASPQGQGFEVVFEDFKLEKK